MLPSVTPPLKSLASDHLHETLFETVLSQHSILKSLKAAISLYGPQSFYNPERDRFREIPDKTVMVLTNQKQHQSFEPESSSSPTVIVLPWTVKNK